MEKFIKGDQALQYRRYPHQNRAGAQHQKGRQFIEDDDRPLLNPVDPDLVGIILGVVWK